MPGLPVEDWNRLVGLIDVQEDPDGLEGLGQELLSLVGQNQESSARLAEQARHDNKVATALHLAMLIDSQKLADLVGLDHLVAAWCESNRLTEPGSEHQDPWMEWPIEVVLGLIPTVGSMTTEDAWSLVLRLLAAAPTEWVITMIGCGPLEDLLDADPDRVADLVEQEAPRNPRLREALVHTWQQATPDPAFDRVKRLAESRPPGSA